MTNFDPQEAEWLADKLSKSRWHPNSGVNQAAAMLRAAVKRVRVLEAGIRDAIAAQQAFSNKMLPKVRTAEKVIEAARRVVTQWQQTDDDGDDLYERIGFVAQALQEYDRG